MDKEERSESELVECAQNELPYRSGCYSLLMQRYENRVLQTCWRLIQNKQDAEDVYQEVLIKVFHGLKNFRQDSAFGTWLFRIAHNECINYIRRRSQGLIPNSQVFDESVHDQPVVDSAEVRIDIEGTLGQLKFSDREILTLRYIAGLSIKEIAHLLGIKDSATKMRLSRASQKFIEIYQASGSPEETNDSIHKDD